ncbi:MAG TPA: PspC domain-containing protein [Allosphingosinicella sp.]|nr:PspC domain-containing protein [Allosphingosinicella sp.]
MNIRGTRFAVDRENGKIAGVCAGIANHLGLDPTIVRIAFVLAALAIKFPLFLIAYGVLAAVGQPKRGLNRPSASGNRLVSREETRERMRDLDRRMQEIETYVTSSNSKLAREIEELR